MHKYFFGLGIFIACSCSPLVNAQQQQPNYSNNPSYSSATTQNAPAPDNDSSHSLRFGFVNSKKCLENSKLGKQEQANFEKMKQQMETVLKEKESQLEELETKLNDDDYMDSINEEVSSELRAKRRSLRNEGMQLQNQFMQTLQQANSKIIQKFTDALSKASALVAKEGINGQPLEAIFTDEAATYFSPKLDITKQVTDKLNVLFDAEQKDNASKSR